MAEIDDGELATLRQMQGVVARIMGNPSARRKVLLAQKEAFPGVSIPELDVEIATQSATSHLKTELDAVNARIAAIEAKRDEEARMTSLHGQWEQGRNLLRSQGWGSDGISKVEEFMEKRGIADHEVAAAAYERLVPQDTPVSPSNARFDIFSTNANAGDESMKMLMAGNDEGFLNSVIPSVLSSARSGGVRR